VESLNFWAWLEDPCQFCLIEMILNNKKGLIVNYNMVGLQYPIINFMAKNYVQKSWLLEELQ